MIKISKQNNSLIVEGIDNVFYPNNGDNSYPLNSLIVVTDNSDMATFRSVATNDVLFSGLIQNITINGEAVTKDNIIQKFDAVSNSSTGGGGGSTVDAYTKEESDTKFATKTELTNVQTVANDADTKVDALTPRVESVETAMDGKQDLLVSGTNIKTINNQSILGEGNIEISDYYTKTEADEIFATTTQVNHQAADISALQTDMRGKQATLVSGENIKTINSESILGTGDIQINGVSEEQAQEIAKIPTLETDMMGKQDTLVSGTNIKTINGESVLGEGNIEVAKKTDIPSTDNLATKDELTAVETVANNADAKADAATSRIESVETTLGNKQDNLVSGTNIKTINSQSILGSGDLAISGVSEEQAQEIAKIPTLETEIAQKANVSDVPTVQTGYQGTNKKYIYSEGNIDNNNKTVVSNIVNVNDNPDTVKLGIYEWGGSMGKVIKLPSATTTAAGVMTAADKTKLDSIPENIPTQTEVDNIASNVSALQTAMGNKQDTLVSGTNIKTINNQSILGEGNIEITGGEVDLTNYYTKTETDTKFATKDELTAVETVANNADTKADAATSRVESVETSLGNKQDTLVSGTNIKTVNSQSILGSGDLTISGVSEEQAQEIAKIPTLETEIAQKANVSDVPTVQTGLDGTNKNYIYSDARSPYARVISKVYPTSSADKIDLRLYLWTTDTSQVSYSTEFLSKATTTSAGVMTAADKTKLDSIPETIPSQSEIDGIAANVSALQTDMANKQPTLVSGTNIKTINGNSILGEGNLVIEGGGIDLSNYYNKTEVDTKLDTKQNNLVSGTNIKTINSQSILGEGNIEVTIPDATTSTSGAMSAADKTKLDSISNEWTGTQAEYDALATKDNNIIYYVTE